MLFFGLQGQDFKMLDPQLVPRLGELRFRCFVLIVQARSGLNFRSRLLGTVGLRLGTFDLQPYSFRSGPGFLRRGLRPCNWALLLLMIQGASGRIESRNTSQDGVLRERPRCQR